MVHEIAMLTIDPANAAAFEEALREAVNLFRRAEGCRSMVVERSIETPGSYRLVVGWDNIDAHMVTFRQSDDFATWRGLVGGFFVEPPQVQHTTRVIDGF